MKRKPTYQCELCVCEHVRVRTLLWLYDMNTKETHMPCDMDGGYESIEYGSSNFRVASIHTHTHTMTQCGDVYKMCMILFKQNGNAQIHHRFDCKCTSASHDCCAMILISLFSPRYAEKECE